MFEVISVAIGYLLGSISFSYLYGKWFKGIDIREHGSGNAGATNTLRVLGKKAGILVFLLDIGKGVLAVWIGRWAAADDTGWVPVLCGLAAVIGHNWPVYFGFRGGKGIATTIGALASLSFLPALIAGVLAILTIAVTRYVSLGSLVFAALLPFLIGFMGDSAEILTASIIFAVFAFVRHRTNIVKLAQGRENKLSGRKPM